MMRKQTMTFLGLAAALAFLVGCNKPGSSADGGAGGDIIKVGEYASLTGSEASFGDSSHKGTQLAVDEVNAAGGVLGKKVQLLTEDNRSQAGESATIVKKFISRDKVVAVLGEVASGRSLEAGPICQQSKIPMISPSSTNPKVTEVGDYVFRVCFLDSFQGAVLAKFAQSTLKAKKVAILHDVKSAYSVGLADYFEKRFRADGGQIVANQKYSSGDKDYNAPLTAIKGANPDAVFVPGYYTEAGLIAIQARSLGITVPIFGGDGWEAPELIEGEATKKAMEGCFYSTHYSPEDKGAKVQTFLQKYKEKFGKVPDSMAALGYDSAMVLFDSIKRAGTTAEPQLRDAIAATKDYEGVTGKTAMDEHRDAKKPAVIVTIKDGQFKYVETIAPSQL
ncbi:MAG: ethanolamine utilization protein EutJ [Verrucomicrobiales bacterium]|nr:ethanolamine utilization protein EutJ [Verrucomicrobiales bacterium]